MSMRNWTLLVLLSVIWGGAFFFAKVAVSELPPFTVVLCRVVLAALTLHLVLRLRGIAFVASARWPAYAGMAVLNNVIPFSLLFYGQTQIGAGLASILNATTPVFAVIVAHVFTADERITGGKAAGVALGIAGVAVLVGLDALSEIGNNIAAQVACLGAALSYGFAGVFGRRFKGDAPVASAAGQVTASSLIMLPVVFIIDQPWTLPVPGIEVIGAVTLLGIVSTGIAYILFFSILRSSGATNVMLVTLLVPVTAILLGAAVLGERLAPSDLAGMALIGLGLAAIDGRAWRRFAGQPVAVRSKGR
ncbi:DMT family transporter [Tepidamorphus sp. 3E244]|uniref:DMT family transporter n=1 Tax=Tepidamorphus sp. 3E244 TaxID=3385498 RepID=UPI0038FC526D